jgi:competence protein ComEC
VAGAATAPIAAAHFNQVPHYGLIANLLSVPLMGYVIMPAAVLAALLAPFGLHWLGLYLMDPPIRWILGVADRISGWDGALSFVPAPPPAALPLLVLGALFIILWRHPTRAVGLLPMTAALGLWIGAERPLVLVSSSGGLVGVIDGEARALSKPRGDGFSARSWLENDGDPAEQVAAAERSGFGGAPGAREFRVGALSAVHLTGRGARDRVSSACKTADIVVISVEAEAQGGCLLYDRSSLSQTGALAIWPDGDQVRIVAVADRSGVRRWNASARRQIRGAAVASP